MFFVVQSTDESVPGSLTFTNLVTLTLNEPQAGRAAIPVFTDRPGAEEFRDKNCPGYEIWAMSDASRFAFGLRAARAVASFAAFDPWRPGLRVQAVLIDDLLTGLGG